MKYGIKEITHIFRHAVEQVAVIKRYNKLLFAASLRFAIVIYALQSGVETETSTFLNK